MNKLPAIGGAVRGSKGDSLLRYDVIKGKMFTAKYVADAKFEHGDATIQIQLIRTSGERKVLSFHVNSPVFLQ